MAQWGTVQVGIPDALEKLVETIESFAQALLAILNIALKILQVIKAFLVGFLNPLAAIIEAIINEIQAFLNDIRQLGLYISGDLDPQWPFDELLGGYQGYERRMIARLVDRRDPSRPAFSSRSGVIALFLYVSVDATALATLIVLIQRILRFFGQVFEPKQFTIPVGLEVTYGVDGAPLTQFGGLKPSKKRTSGTIPNVANLRWSMAPPAKGSSIAWPLPPPFGFLIEVSVVRDGLLLAWEAPAREAIIETDGNQTRIFGQVSDGVGRPFRLYGGFDQIDTNGVELGGSDAITPSGLKPGAARLVAMRDVNDPVLIPIEALKDGDKHLLQKTFFVRTGGNVGALLRNVAQGFSIQLKQSAMPWEAEFTQDNNGKVTGEAVGDAPAQTVFVRVAAVSNKLKDAIDVDDDGAVIQGQEGFQWQITEQEITSKGQANQGVRALPAGGSDYDASDRSDPSSPLTVTFPSSQTQDYLDAVTAALAVMVLSRSDLPLWLEGLTATRLELKDSFDTAIAEAEVKVVTEKTTLASQGYIAINDPFLRLAAPPGTFDDLDAAQDELFVLRRNLALAWPVTDGTARLETGLEDLAKYLMPMVLGRNPPKYFTKDRTSPAIARRDILRRCRAVANQLYRDSGNLGVTVETLVVERGAPLIGDNAFKWNDFNASLPALTILESLDTTDFIGASPKQGIGLNPWALGMDSNVLEEFLAGFTFIAREPGFRVKLPEKATFFRGDGSADDSPVIYKRSGILVEEIFFIRNVWHANSEVYGSAAAVLAIAAAPSTLSGGGGWIAIRLLPQGLPPIEQFLDTIMQWMEAILAGVQGIIEIIKRFIAFIESRILEIQSLINRIVNLLNSLLLLQVPAASGLVVVANGTDGILSELITAENKPSDSAAAYGGGIVLLSGGLNSSLAALLASFFPQE